MICKSGSHFAHGPHSQSEALDWSAHGLDELRTSKLIHSEFLETIFTTNFLSNILVT